MNILTSTLISTSSVKLLVTVVCTGGLGFNRAYGESEWKHITWIDITGETAVTLVALACGVVILASRPLGFVTNLLHIGFTYFVIASFQDLLDEFIWLQPQHIFDDLLESFIAPIAMLVICIGFYQWYLEQQKLNAQLRRRERFYREHSHIDYATDLYTSLYMEQQIKRELSLNQRTHIPLSLIAVDIDNFDEFNRSYGEGEGDRLLKQVADLIIMNIRHQDLACRYTADRFFILLPETDSKPP